MPPTPYTSMAWSLGTGETSPLLLLMLLILRYILNMRCLYFNTQDSLTISFVRLTADYNPLNHEK